MFSFFYGCLMNKQIFFSQRALESVDANKRLSPLNCYRVLMVFAERTNATFDSYDNEVQIQVVTDDDGVPVAVIHVQHDIIIALEVDEYKEFMPDSWQAQLSASEIMERCMGNALPVAA